MKNSLLYLKEYSELINEIRQLKELKSFIAEHNMTISNENNFIELIQLENIKNNFLKN